jgi:hypothetical protein
MKTKYRRIGDPWVVDRHPLDLVAEAAQSNQQSNLNDVAMQARNVGFRTQSGCLRFCRQTRLEKEGPGFPGAFLRFTRLRASFNGSVPERLRAKSSQTIPSTSRSPQARLNCQWSWTRQSH